MRSSELGIRAWSFEINNSSNPRPSSPTSSSIQLGISWKKIAKELFCVVCYHKCRFDSAVQVARWVSDLVARDFVCGNYSSELRYGCELVLQRWMWHGYMCWLADLLYCMPPRRRGRGRGQIPEESEGQNEEVPRSGPFRRRDRQVEDEVDELAVHVDDMELVMARFQRMNPQTFNDDEPSSDAESDEICADGFYSSNLAGTYSGEAAAAATAAAL
ncbi:hypothetical protein F511_38049 [Dorcoceras hygrometricum]|uniref:Uncharacterized protein n=1 Tax=Dorcoceras hygrometricum TaxID=472368 RepID=A0A2Z7DBJ9_9LAMI|nr:hypothetical protein F511_38049 [Dorcoceras hygrometricum]